jgi:hypothetical protein
MTNTKEEINQALEIELDKQFPKGDKARGKALVLFAVAQNEINKTRQKMIEEFKEMIDEKLRFMGTNWEMYNAIEILTALKSSLEGKGKGK